LKKKNSWGAYWEGRGFEEGGRVFRKWFGFFGGTHNFEPTALNLGGGRGKRKKKRGSYTPR